MHSVKYTMGILRVFEKKHKKNLEWVHTSAKAKQPYVHVCVSSYHDRLKEKERSLIAWMIYSS